MDVDGSHLVIEGKGFDGEGIRIAETSSDVAIGDCSFTRCKGEAIKLQPGEKEIPQGIAVERCEFQGPFEPGFANIPFVGAWGNARLTQCRFVDVYDPTGQCQYYSKECPESIRIRSGDWDINRCFFGNCHKQSCHIRILPEPGKRPAIGRVRIENNIFDCTNDDAFSHAFGIDTESTSEQFDWKRPGPIEIVHNTFLIRQARRNINLDDGWLRHLEGKGVLIANNLFWFMGGGGKGFCERADWHGNVSLATWRGEPCPGIRTAKWAVDADYRPTNTSANRNFVLGHADPLYTVAEDFYGNARDLEAPTVGAVEPLPAE